MFILFFRHQEWLVEDDPFYMKFWPKYLQKSRISTDIRS